MAELRKYSLNWEGFVDEMKKMRPVPAVHTWLFTSRTPYTATSARGYVYTTPPTFSNPTVFCNLYIQLEILFRYKNNSSVNLFEKSRKTDIVIRHFRGQVVARSFCCIKRQCVTMIVTICHCIKNSDKMNANPGCCIGSIATFNRVPSIHLQRKFPNH